ncbi:hypothetical protein cypCar_00001406, partial [Cyprinus carpio]
FSRERNSELYAVLTVSPQERVFENCCVTYACCFTSTSTNIDCLKRKYAIFWRYRKTEQLCVSLESKLWRPTHHNGHRRGQKEGVELFLCSNLILLSICNGDSP